MTQLDHAAQVASMDQATAQMVDLGRGWAGFYRAMVEGGIPPRIAARMVDRQHAAAMQVQVLQAAGAAQGAG